MISFTIDENLQLKIHMSVTQYCLMKANFARFSNSDVHDTAPYEGLRLHRRSRKIQNRVHAT